MQSLNVFYLTYDGDYSQKNMNRIMELSSPNQNVTNIDGIQGIYNAHKMCADVSMTDHFFVIDGDAYLHDDFDLGFIPSDEKMIYPRQSESNCTLVWRAYNPVARITYGYGGVKLFHKSVFADEVDGIVDMSTTIANKGFPYYPVPTLSNDTVFNVSPFATWRSAFRECVKLSSKINPNQKDSESDARLTAWLNPNPDAEFSAYARMGARMGKQFGQNENDMTNINDWQWLKTVFEELVHGI